MNYGLYLSATGVLANSYRQDVIANNLANSETVGFKRDRAYFRERLTEAQQRRLNPETWSNPLLEDLGGGLRVVPMSVDPTQGDLEETGNKMDVAIQGDGFFAVRDGKDMRLTRNGRLMVDREGRLSLASSGHNVLDERGRPITLDGMQPVDIRDDGKVVQDGQEVAKIGVFDVPDPTKLRKRGSTLLDYPELNKNLKAASPSLRSGFFERSNVDPVTELTGLMEAQRQLEANANMIRFQDQMLSRLVSEVGKIS